MNECRDTPELSGHAPLLGGRLGVMVTPLFKRSRGRIFRPVFFRPPLTNLLWPVVQPCDTWLVVLVAAVVVRLNREAPSAHQGA